jgi:PAS domain S-box-containing protein
MAETTVPPTETRQQLHSIVRKEIPFDKKAREVLAVGAEYLDLDCGYITRIDTEIEDWEVVITTDTEEFPAGLRCSLEDTYCRETITTETHYALHDAPAQGWADDPAIQTRNHDTYFGIPLIVNKHLYGTVCFVATEPRSEPFSDVETWFIEHLAGLLERELARDHVKAELTNQTNFTAVLNRVLRHNLRNDISVIRGYTELLADELEDVSTIETVLSHIDDLIEMSQKARELQQIVTASSERRRTEVGTFIEGIANKIAQDYPEASISVEYDEERHVNVLQNFDRAVEELVENAVKHSGDSPTITVAIEAVPNAIEIRIDDDGPGLPKQEAQVLTAGEETPLFHGSGLGLWLAYWIVTSHDGSLEADVTERGTVMTMTIPRKSDVGVQQQLTELSRSRDRYKSTFDEATDAMVIADDDGRYVEVNGSAADLFGLPERELLGRTIGDFTDDVDIEEEWQQFRTADEQQGMIRIVRPDGSERVVEYAATPDIVPGEHLAVLRDVTEREEREREVTALKERYETLLEAAPDPVFVADIETGELIEANAAAETMLGRSREEIVGQHQSDLHPPDQTEQYRQLFDEYVHSEGLRRYLPDGSPIYVVTSDGEQIQVEISVRKVSLPDGPVAFGIFRDITGRIERENQQVLAETVFQNAQDAMFLIDVTDEREFHVNRVNQAYEELTGLSATDIQGKNPRAVVGEEYGAEIESHYNRCVERRETVQYPEAIPVDGVKRFWETNLTPVVRDGSVVQLVGATRDVTDRRQRRHALREEREQFARVLETSPVGITILNVKGEFIRANKRAEEILGLSEATITDRTYDDPDWDIVDEDGNAIAESNLPYRRVIETGDPVYEYEHGITNDEGAVRWLSINAAPLTSTDGDINAVVATITHLTEDRSHDF